MNLEKLPKLTKRGKKRVGRGIGSGKGGHTVGRGQKGQKSRRKIGLVFEGTKIKKSLLKRLPLLPGKGKFKPSSKKPIVVNLKYLKLLPKGGEVSLETLIKGGIVDGQQAKSVGVKILGEGQVTRAYEVKLPVSKGAKAKIEKAGGKVVTKEKEPKAKLKKARMAKKGKKA